MNQLCLLCQACWQRKHSFQLNIVFYYNYYFFLTFLLFFSFIGPRVYISYGLKLAWELTRLTLTVYRFLGFGKNLCMRIIIIIKISMGRCSKEHGCRRSCLFYKLSHIACTPMWTGVVRTMEKKSQAKNKQTRATLLLEFNQLQVYCCALLQLLYLKCVILSQLL